jgi:uncharacterized protein (DUF1697 family)
MSRYIVFLRAVNVGGTGKLPMEDLRKLCEAQGYEEVKTYIASGNVVFTSNASKRAVKQGLEGALKAYAKKPVGVVVRTPTEIRTVLEANPFSGKAPSQTVAIPLDRPLAEDALQGVAGQVDEEVKLGEAEIYVYYASGIGRSKLRIPAAKAGTARNMNTLLKMLELASAS